MSDQSESRGHVLSGVPTSWCKIYSLWTKHHNLRSNRAWDCLLEVSNCHSSAPCGKINPNEMASYLVPPCTRDFKFGAKQVSISSYLGDMLLRYLWHCSTPYERIGWTNWVQIKNQCTLSHPACAYQVWCESEVSFELSWWRAYRHIHADMTPCYGFAYGPGVINIITLWKTTSLSTASEALTFGDFGPPGGGGGRRCNSNNREAISGS